jgi:hypothetical protein
MEEVDIMREIGTPSWFAQPSAAFRPAAYWFWHSLPSQDEMHEQLVDFRDKGFGTILIQVRLALPRSEYLSPAFVKAYTEAVAIMADLGLVAGLYDDYNWTSGQAGGRTVDGADHLREQHLFWSTSAGPEGTIDGIEAPFVKAMGADIAGWLYEGGAPVFDEWQVVTATIHPADRPDVDLCRDVLGSVKIIPENDGCRFVCDEPIPQDHRLTVFLSARCRTSRIINYLLSEAGERFVTVGLEPLAEALGPLMPEPLQFLFFDQPAPNFYSWRQRSGDLGNSILFAEHLPKRIEMALGIPFHTALLALITDLGAETDRIRCRFFEVYTELMYDGFFRPLKAFAQKYRLRLTGHEILPHVGSFALNGGFTSIDPRVVPAVDFFGLDALRDETAVDANNFVAQLAPKLGDSVARAHGRSRAITELYATAVRSERRGSGQWELTPSTLRAQSIRLLLLGARQVLFHALYQTDGQDGDPRLFVNPRFDFAPGLNFEPWWPHHLAIADETARLSAFLEEMVPQTPVALLYPLHTAWAKGPKHAHATHFGAWCEALNDNHCDYMIVDENSLEKAEVRDGRLHVNGLSFSAIALPSISILKSVRTAGILAEFRNAGGEIWASGELPVHACDGELDMDIDITDLSANEPNSQSVATLLKRLHLGGPQISVPAKTRYVTGLDADGFSRIVVFHDGDQPGEASIGMPGGLECEIWNAVDGSVSKVKPATVLQLELQPHQLVCIRLCPRADEEPHTTRLFASLPPSASRSLKDDWTFAADGVEKPHSISVERGWQEQGYASFSGIGIYACRFTLEAAASLVLDLPGVSTAVTAMLDGKPMGSRSFAPYRIALGRVEPGSRLLELHISNTAANRYYADTPYAGDLWPDQSGLTARPQLLFFDNDEIKE